MPERLKGPDFKSGRPRARPRFESWSVHGVSFFGWYAQSTKIERSSARHHCLLLHKARPYPCVVHGALPMEDRLPRKQIKLGKLPGGLSDLSVAANPRVLFLCYNNRMSHLVNHHLKIRVPTVAPTTTVESVRRRISTAKEPWDSINYIYVIDVARKLIGVVSIKELFRAGASDEMHTLMRRDPVAVHEHAHQEHVAAVAIAHSLKAVPVTNHEGEFLGIVSSDAILRILHEQHVESALRHAGFMQPHVHFLDVMKARFGELFRARVGWLAVGLLGGMFAASITGFFEEVLLQEIILAFFIPVVVYLSDAVGTQTETLFIRSLAIERVHLSHYIVRELSVGVALGSLFGLIAYVFVMAVWQHAAIALILALTFFCTIIVATIVALLIPWIFTRLHRDPAIGSGPFATIIQDVFSLVIYFLIASVLV